jgi:hypothetical protein
MSARIWLAHGSFSIPWDDLPPVHQTQKTFLGFGFGPKSQDNLAIGVAKALMRALESGGHTTGGPWPEGKDHVWFRCSMQCDDAGVSLGVHDTGGGYARVYIVVLQIPKHGMRRDSGLIDPEWKGLSVAIQQAAVATFGDEATFPWEEFAQLIRDRQT